MGHDFKISIIIPVFNVEDYIKRAFDSLLNQTIGFENLEVIFIDDNSTDSSPEIIKKYSNQYDNVNSIFLNKNSGLGGKPRNIGMAHATTDYLMFLDSDDILMEDACKTLYDEIIADDVDVVSGVHTGDGINPSEGLWESILTNPHEDFQTRQNKTRNLLKNFPLKINSIDDCKSVIGDFAFQPKIYKKSFLENNSIIFPEGILAEDSVFLVNALLNANGIKYINKIVYHYVHERTDGNNPSVSYIHSKKNLKSLLVAFYKMYYISLEKNKSEIFKEYLLYQKLEYFLKSRLFKSNLSVEDVLDLLIYSTPLFILCGEVNSNLSDLYRFISNRDYENALRVIFGKDTLNQKDIKIISNVNSFKNDCNLIELQSDSWLNQFENENPDLFIFKQNENEEISDYCNKNNIPIISINNNEFDFKQILDSIKFNYIPYLKHIVVFYELDDLRQIIDIHNHFYSIDYPFKHLKLITEEKNLFLKDAILKSDLNKIHLDDNYYFCFCDLSLNPDFIRNNLLDNSHKHQDNLQKIKNTIFSSADYNKIVKKYLMLIKEGIHDEFFIIDSNNVKEVTSRLYGYALYDNKIIQNENFCNGLKLDGMGVYVAIEVADNQIIISQDFNGSYGLYIYQIDGYFAISNSFLKLAEYLEDKFILSYNKDYAHAFLVSSLCSHAYNQTLINEIKSLPRNYRVIIDINCNNMEFDEIHYEENTIALNSEKGMEILDKWFNKWVNIFRDIKLKTNNILISLSGGFDSRVVAAIWLSSNIDLDYFYVFSINDNLHTHTEDFEIASQIAKEFGFKLNNSKLISEYEFETISDLDSILDISFYTKLGFHKEYSFKKIRYLNPQYDISGKGGEGIRSFFNKTALEFLNFFINRAKNLDESLIDSTRKVIEYNFDNFCEKFNIVDKNSKDLPEYIYNEVRSRNHFGKSSVEQYLANIIPLAPLLDPDLYKLKLNTEDCKDNNLLIAVILSRYCPKLLDFKFEGNRKLNDETICYAKSINNQYPFLKPHLELISKPINEVIIHKDKKLNNETSPDPNELIKKVAYSKSFKNEFEKYFSEPLYNKLIKNSQLTDYFPLSDFYASLAILKIISCIEHNKSTFYNSSSGWLNHFLSDDF